MCGISGIISRIPDYCEIHLLSPMLDSLSHRGPDQSDVTNLGNNGYFGHNRLAIIDLDKRAKQPMWDHDNRFCLTFNGEIYNFHDIRKELTNLGHQFRTQCDAEVLVEAWAEWGISSINHLVGMFAFAIWDKKLQELYLVRDRMGEKPLYYAPIKKDFHNGILFASELKAIVRYPFFEKKISMSALNHYLSFNCTPTDDAIFKDVYKVPPASYVYYDLTNHRHVVKEYWSLANCFHTKISLSFADAQVQLENLLSQTIYQKMIADVPVGVFLSGGLDSATIVRHMNQTNEQVNTFSIGFNEKSYNELDLSQQTATYLKVNHQAKIVTPDISQILSKIVNTFDEPFADNSLIPTYLLCEFARSFVKVSLSGDGGDELFGGYITYQANRYWQFMQYLPRFVRNAFFNMSQYWPVSFNKISFDYKLKQFIRGTLMNLQMAHLSWREIFLTNNKQKLFHSDYRHVSSWNVNEKSLSLFDDVSDCHYLDQAMYVDMKTWLVDDILVKMDRASMAHSLEVRSPFLDHRLVEFAARLPISFKIQHTQGKRILKASNANRLPLAVLRGKKKGFNSPIAHWLANELFEIGYEITMGNQLGQWFNREQIAQMWFEHKNRVCDNSHRLFNLVCLGLWCQHYL